MNHYTHIAAFFFRLLPLMLIFGACMDREIIPDTVSQQINAGFRVENDSCTAPCEVRFFNTSQGATSFIWRFGDGTLSEEPNPTHIYDEGGTFDVRLTAQGEGNVTDDTIGTVFIAMPSPNAVIARFDVDNDSCIAPCTVSFDASNSQNATSFSWDYGDGQSENGSLVSHNYDIVGQYEVSLIVEGTEGKDTLVRTITILPSGLTACFNIDSISNNGFAPATVYISDCSVDAVSYSWAWGDGTSPSSESGLINHVYERDGEFQITLTIFDQQGNEDQVTKTVTISAALTFEKTFGGTQSDFGVSIIQTEDGGFMLLGTTASKGLGGFDIWLIKTDEGGDVVWDRTYGGFGDDFGETVIQTQDGGYVLVGDTFSKGAGNADTWLIKIDNNGNVLWDRTFGGTEIEDVSPQTVIQTDDNGFAIIGNTTSKGAGDLDFWLIKTDWQGNLLWDQTFGGSGEDYARAIVQMDDGGFGLFGQTVNKGAGGFDFWLVRTNGLGNQLWDQTYGRESGEFGYGLLKRDHGGLALFGSGAGKGTATDDFLLILTDDDGNILSESLYGGLETDGARTFTQTIDGGFALAGTTNSQGAGAFDWWLVRTDKDGNQLWDRTFGGGGNEQILSIIQTADGGFALLGETESRGQGNFDFWLIKTDPEGNVN